MPGSIGSLFEAHCLLHSFAAMMVVQVIVVALYYPETKGYSLEMLQQRLKLSQTEPWAAGLRDDG